MNLQVFDTPLTVCKLATLDAVDLTRPLTFVGVTPDELSVVCPTAATPAQTLAREDGWRALRVVGQLDFSLVGILSRISATLAGAGVSIFAVSTYDTDYLLVKEAQLDTALASLDAAGYEIASAASA